MYLLKPNPAKQLRLKDFESEPRFQNLRKLLIAAENQGNYRVTPLPGCPRIPPFIQLRQYQQQAVASWFANQGRGTLKMATGSGKTITALAIACELYQKISLQVLLIVCPYRHLVTQWAREYEKFGLAPILAFENVHTWQSQLSTGATSI